jgi:hypothetical protein
MLQLRHPGGNRDAYNFRRDITVLFRELARGAAYRLAQTGWHPVVREWAERAGLTEQDLGQAAVAMARFINLANNPATATLQDAWENSGLTRVKNPALMALLFEIGAGATASYFHAVRDAQPAGFVPHDMPKIGALADEVESALRAGSDRVRARRADQIDQETLD